MTVYCDNDHCEYFEEGICYADRLDMDSNGVCMTVRFKAEESDKNQE